MLSARRGLGSFDHRAASLQPSPPQAREVACAASRADDDRHFTGGRPATAASGGLVRHLGWPKPRALCPPPPCPLGAWPVPPVPSVFGFMSNMMLSGWAASATPLTPWN